MIRLQREGQWSGYVGVGEKLGHVGVGRDVTGGFKEEGRRRLNGKSQNVKSQ